MVDDTGEVDTPCERFLGISYGKKVPFFAVSHCTWKLEEAEKSAKCLYGCGMNLLGRRSNRTPKFEQILRQRKTVLTFRDLSYFLKVEDAYQLEG